MAAKCESQKKVFNAFEFSIVQIWKECVLAPMTQQIVHSFSMDEQAIEAFKQYLYELEKSVQQRVELIRNGTIRLDSGIRE